MFESIYKKIFPTYLQPYAKTLLIYALIGYLIRLAVAPITWLPQDFISTTWNSYVITHNGILDYFRYYPSVVTPAFSYFYAPWMKVIDLLIPGFYDPYVSSVIAGHPVFYANYPAVDWSVFTRLAHDPNLFKFIFLSKLPMFFFDYGIALILVRFVTKPKGSLLVYKLWMLNPLTIYAVFIMGELHVLVSIFFLVLGLYLAIKKPGYKAALLLAVSALIWHLSLVFIPIIGLFMRKNTDKFFPYKFILVAVAPWIIQALALQVFLTGGDAVAGYRPGVLFVSPFLEQGASIDLTMGFRIVLFPLFYALIILFLIVSPRLKPNQVALFMLPFLAMFFSTLVFMPHWIAWLAPFLIIFIAKSESRLVYVVCAAFILSYAGFLIYWDSLTTSALFQPLFPEIWRQPGPASLLDQYGGGGFSTAIVNGARSLMSAGLIFLGWKAFKQIRASQEADE